MASNERYDRSQGRIEKRRRSECLSALLELSCHQPSDDIGDEDVSSIEDATVKGCQTEITFDYISGLQCFNQRKIDNELSE